MELPGNLHDFSQKHGKHGIKSEFYQVSFLDPILAGKGNLYQFEAYAIRHTNKRNHSKHGMIPFSLVILFYALSVLEKEKRLNAV